MAKKFQNRYKHCEVCGGHFARLDTHLQRSAFARLDTHLQRSACGDADFMPHDVSRDDEKFEDDFFGHHNKCLKPLWEK
jgi:hypothetical protein